MSARRAAEKVVKRVFRTRRRSQLAGFLLVYLIITPLDASAGQGHIGTVSYQDGKLALAFDRTPTETALAAIREKTGHEIILPANLEAKSVTIQTGPRPLDGALRHFLRAIGLDSFALVYQRNGESRQIIVLGPRTQNPAHIFSIPQYIPQTGEPVYIPPVDGSRYTSMSSAQTVSSDE